MFPLLQTIFGTIGQPPGIAAYQGFQQGGLFAFITVLLRLMVVIGGLWTLFNIVLAGYQFLGAGGKPDDIKNAWAKIYQSLIGLVFIAGSFTLAGIFGQIFFGSWTAILKPVIYGP